MKRIVFLISLTLGLAGAARGQPMNFYVNDGLILSPPDLAPQIDALNFINNNYISIINTNLEVINSQLWDTSDTINYTNNGVMVGIPGFRFDTAPSGSGQRKRAANFVNNGTISVGSSTNTVIGSVNGIPVIAGLPRLICSATNITSPGVLQLGFESLCSLDAETIDLTRGTVSMQATGVDVYNQSYYFNGGIFDNYWNATNNVFNPRTSFGTFPPSTPIHQVTNRYYAVFAQQLSSTNFSYFVDEEFTGPSNRVVRAVFIANTNSAISANVYFPSLFGNDIVVEWTAPVTNDPTMTFTNYIYLFDDLLNLGDPPWIAQPPGPPWLIQNGFAGPNPTYVPLNFLGNFFGGFFQNGGFFQTQTRRFIGGQAQPSAVDPTTFNNSVVTNVFTAYEGLFLPSSVVLTDIQGANVTNVPGRITLTADKAMDLSHAHISSVNYLSVSSTNHYLGSSHAVIAAPYIDINLRSTNGLMVLTNLLSPVLAHSEGTIDLYSCRWTNESIIDGAAITNHYHVLFANTALNPFSPSRVQNLTLRSISPGGGPDSIVIHDIVNVLSNGFYLDTTSLTLATNAPGSPSPFGAINLLGSATLFSASTPRLQYLTNDGFIQTRNAVFFGGSRSSPYYNSNYNEPYYVFVNRGGVTNQSSLIWATNFQNSGTFFAQNGSIYLQKARSATLVNGAFYAPGVGGTITIEGENLYVSNHVMQASGALTLTVTNSIDDGSLVANSADAITNKNIWSATGINLLYPTAAASLLGTTITNTDLTYANVRNVWAAADRGCSPVGFVSNAALGRLILDGQDPDSLFTFTGAGVNNAIYVDYLELRNFTANTLDAAKNYIGVQIDPNMKIYFAQAMANGVSIAERLNGRNGGRFCWVSNYNTGFFSSTNIVYPDGSTNRLNAALVASCVIDSNGDGTPNCADRAPIPVLSPRSIALSVAVTQQPAPAAVVSWSAFPATVNSLLAASTPSSTNWQLVTNFTFSGPLPGKVTVTDLIKTNGPRFYKVRVGSP